MCSRESAARPSSCAGFSFVSEAKEQAEPFFARTRLSRSIGAIGTRLVGRARGTPGGYILTIGLGHVRDLRPSPCFDALWMTVQVLILHGESIGPGLG